MSRADTDAQVKLWTLRLRGRFPDESQDLPDAELQKRVRGLLGLTETLRIVEDKDVLRFIALMSVLLTPEQRRSPLVEGVVKRIMAAQDWDAEKRLDFLYEHIVGRPVSADEPDLGPTFVPR
jgi:hypothetical protein